jgi:UDP-GlcNAc:undecaprenyl-phosphate GlcNAc-1-phosphate transferase
MNGMSVLSYVAIFGGATLLSLVLVPLVLRVAIKLDVLDHPGGYKQQKNPVPYLGGVAIIIAFAGSILAAAAIRPPVAGFTELAITLGSAVALGLVGLLDDLRGLPLWPRFTAMFVAAGALWMVGVRVHLFDDGFIDLAITLAWVVGITNAFNLLDNMDGLSAGIAVIASASFFVIAAANGQFLVAALSLAVAGAAIGFLRHNRYPARIYMGDAGSLFLGFMLAVVGLKLRFDAPREVTAFVPILVLGVAIFDTTLVVVTRLRSGKSIFQGGTDHTSHRLVLLGMPVPGAVGLVYTAAALSGWLAIVVARQSDLLSAYLLLALWVAVGTVAGTYLVRATGDNPLPVKAGQQRNELAQAERR